MDRITRLFDQLFRKASGVARKAGAAMFLVGLVLLMFSLGALFLTIAVTPWLDWLVPANTHNLLGEVYGSGFLHPILWSWLPGYDQVYTLDGAAAASGIILIVVWVFQSSLWARQTFRLPLGVVAIAVIEIVIAFAAMYSQAAYAHPSGWPDPLDSVRLV